LGGVAEGLVDGLSGLFRHLDFRLSLTSVDIVSGLKTSCARKWHAQKQDKFALSALFLLLEWAFQKKTQD